MIIECSANHSDLLIPWSYTIPESGLCCGGSCTLEWHSSCTLECDAI